MIEEKSNGLEKYTFKSGNTTSSYQDDLSANSFSTTHRPEAHLNISSEHTQFK